MLKRFMSPTHSNLDFLRSRIYEIKSALFTDSDSLNFRIPTCIISILKVDQTGNLWFLMNQPEYHISCYEPQFPASLSFYRKGISFALNVQGKASVVSNSDTIEKITGVSTYDQQAQMKGVLLMKVSMQHVKYSEWRFKPRTISIWRKVRVALLNFFYSQDSGFTQREYQMG